MFRALIPGLIALAILVDNQAVSTNSSVGYGLKPSKKRIETEWNYSVLNWVVSLAFDFTRSVILSKFIYDFLAKFICKALCKILLPPNSSPTKKNQFVNQKQERLKSIKKRNRTFPQDRRVYRRKRHNRFRSKGKMAATRLCCSRSIIAFSVRSLFKPPSNIPYAGIYRKDGEIVRKDELLVVQRKMNYHPGANVRYDKDFGGQHHLISDCDGTVMITREESIVDQDNELMKSHYEYRNFQGLQKLTFHIIPRRMSNKFRLVGEV